MSMSVLGIISILILVACADTSLRKRKWEDPSHHKKGRDLKKDKAKGHKNHDDKNHHDGGTHDRNDVSLRNIDFAEGTYRIKKSGRYKLRENISFCPNKVQNFPQDVMSCCKPRPDQFQSGGGTYPNFPFAMGFFAAITVEADDVEIDLNKFTIEQCKEHALMQRFFAVIELASSPFIPGQGPRDFGSSFIAGKNIFIHDGYIGRSSHHGIHGNGNVNVRIENVDFKDFEVAAVALNGVKNLKIMHSTAVNRKDVPIYGIWSSALFISQYINEFKNRHSPTTLRVNGQIKTVMDIRNDLVKSIQNVFEDIIIKDIGFIDASSHQDDFDLYNNRHRVVDGNSYGFLTNHLGAAVFGFPYSSGVQLSDGVVFKDVHVLKQKAAITEIVGLWNSAVNKPVIDVAGSIFQVRNHQNDITKPLTISTLGGDTQAEYIGNAVANAQVFVAKAITNGETPGHLPVDRNGITQDIIDWVEAGNDSTNSKRHLSNLLNILAPGETGYVCNGDSMFHVNKGVIGFKIDGTTNIDMEHCSVYGSENTGASGSDICGQYAKSHLGATYDGYGGANVRGFSFAGSNNAKIYQSAATKLVSNAGNVIGFDVHTDSSNIEIQKCHQDGLAALGGSASSALSDDNAYGLMFREETVSNRIKSYCFSNPSAIVGASGQVKDDGRNNVVDENICE